MASNDADIARDRIGAGHAVAAGAGKSIPDTVPHVDWPAIFAGALLASAIGFILMTFGSGLGLSLVDPLDGEGTSMTLVAVTVALWTTWVVVSSLMPAATWPDGCVGAHSTPRRTRSRCATDRTASSSGPSGSWWPGG